MITNLYTIYDMDTEEYSPLFHSVNDVSAIRQFCLTFDKSPEVYRQRVKLCRIGSFDSSTGIVSVDVSCLIADVFEGKDITSWFKERENLLKPEVK